MTDPNTLAHYGKKGMRWGVRKGRVIVARSTASDDHVTTRASRKTPMSSLSTAQLKRANERMQAEKQYKELTSKGAMRKVKNGTAIVSAIIAVPTAYVTAYNMVNSPAGKAAITVGKRAVNKYIHGAIAMGS